ncbi:MULTISPECIES: LptF/LptG family permease [unclassified Kaistella]|uniref:LptF/LptG family permease n=1 Tax=unclassified Kaistella TaxID=2762626 RepID=UPI002736AEFB|nr:MULTISPECIES: LptF/LptG family permease [unclassified Kaistella]MDP2453999.1 LptF/LptG family permease [Kaistella sp. SH11-4b]MDP2457056.1 LptF/LptG family permease [Kaistella sp. SH40-3]MDP2459813.1 LptF/LptG family permease [Kaistella sp. SH19-2b]
MIKKLDGYVIKTFFGPFLFIFSVLFFIFVVNIIWIRLAQFTGKGLSYWEILKLLSYLSAIVVQLVLPLTILLSAIMTFGDFGERYELAAMKAAGISLTRIMLPLFVTTLFFSAFLFVFSNNVVPDFQRKAKNMLYNIAATKPALNFTPGQFIQQLPGYSVKFDKITGENGENLTGVFIHKMATSFEDQQSIVAEKGKFVPAANPNYLKLVLFNGHIYEDQLNNVDYNVRLKQPDQAIKFDTLVSHFNISEIIDKAIEAEKITDDYSFQNVIELNSTIKDTKKSNNDIMKNVTYELVSQTNSYVTYVDQSKAKSKVVAPAKIDTVKIEKKQDMLFSAYNKLENIKQSTLGKNAQIKDMHAYFARVVMHQQRIFSYSVTCIIFFLIGSSLGSIIRKGGLGLPVVIAIVVFILFYVLNLTAENIAWAGNMDPYLAAWLPNIILFPFGVWLTYKALTDSQLFDIEKYKSMFKPLINLFSKNKEHERYR